MNSDIPWLVYGTGAMAGAIIRQATRYGLPVVISGRSAGSVQRLAYSHEITGYAARLPDALKLSPLPLRGVINAAGPYTQTAPPLMHACLQAGIHYIDMSNEWDTHRLAWSLNQTAEAAGSTLIPGTGWGVLAAETLAWHAWNTVPNLASLILIMSKPRKNRTAGTLASSRRVLAANPYRLVRGTLELATPHEGVRTIRLPDGNHTIATIANGDLCALTETFPLRTVEICGTTRLPQAGARVVIPAARRRAQREHREPTQRHQTGGASSPTTLWAYATDSRGRAYLGWLTTHSSLTFTSKTTARVAMSQLDASPGTTTPWRAGVLSEDEMTLSGFIPTR